MIEAKLEAATAAVAAAPKWRGAGAVRSVTGPVVEAPLPGARVGDGVRFELPGAVRAGEVVAFEAGVARLLAFGATTGVGPGTPVSVTGPPRVLAGWDLLGRVVDPAGRVVDGGPPPPYARLEPVPLHRAAPDPLARRPIERALPTGVKVLDALVPLGEGQRVGLFAGPGVGKSTLLGDIAAGTTADVVVAALVGERGREVREFLEGPLAPARQRSVVVVATGEQPALLRARAALCATALAEWFRDRGLKVLLLVDSLTRYARALREVGLAAGEVPARAGYPPSVFAELPRLIERAGNGSTGSITALYTVLAEGEGAADAVSEEVRGLVDGHVVLSRQLAERGHWPAVDVPASLSRVAARITSEAQQRAAEVVRRHVVNYEARRELVVLGAWEPGTDAEGDAAIAAWPRIEALCRQAPGRPVPLEETLEHLEAAAREEAAPCA
ncbi:MAG: FliI/YscN family ATPase [Deltaproteobacteria bacterium]|nr:MAG: FliI/YscN family ATPase [Deltaproteobacteria bacterium]